VKGSGTAPSASEAFWTGEIDYRLPAELIAQHPATSRERSRLMVVDRDAATIEHATFSEVVRFLPPRSLLVANDSRVVPARLRGRKRGSGGAVEALVLGPVSGTRATAMTKVAKPLHENQEIEFEDGVIARVAAPPAQGRVLLDFAPLEVAAVLERCGEIPLPPYIERASGPTDEDRERYQTVYAAAPGSVAAPTAGLHFTNELLAAVSAAGHEFAAVTLHVGPGTFTPVRGSVDTHRMEEESFVITGDTAERIAVAKREGRPLVAVGTTAVRALESAASAGGVRAGAGASSLFIRPGYRFAVVDGLLTNFHLPGSTLLALVMALAGSDLIRRAYEEAVAERYRFYSYGDAMLIR
jgi:S-adenosylmethionine:tRNA ribosyltransferase-isomerase